MVTHTFVLNSEQFHNGLSNADSWPGNMTCHACNANDYVQYRTTCRVDYFTFKHSKLEVVDGRGCWYPALIAQAFLDGYTWERSQISSPLGEYTRSFYSYMHIATRQGGKQLIIKFIYTTHSGSSSMQPWWLLASVYTLHYTICIITERQVRSKYETRPTAWLLRRVTLAHILSRHLFVGSSTLSHCKLYKYMTTWGTLFDTVPCNFHNESKLQACVHTYV